MGTPAHAQCSNPVSFASQVTYGAGFGTNNVAVGDFTGEGRQDIAASCFHVGVSILLANPNGRFSSANDVHFGVGGVNDLEVGDFNNDLNLDLAISRQYSGVNIAFGLGNGMFQLGGAYDTGSIPNAVVIGYFNGDPWPDLATANGGSNNVSILLGTSDGTFTAPPGSPFAAGTSPNHIATGDFNGDSITDLAVANHFGGSVSIMIGNGDGTFQPAESYPVSGRPSSIAVGDFNHDGRPDLAVANRSNSIAILLGNELGNPIRFQPSYGLFTDGESYSIVQADFNADNR